MPATSTQRPLCTLPVAQRPPLSRARKLVAVVYFIVFNLGCLMINASQFVFLLPLRFLPFRWAPHLYKEGIQYTKGSYGCLLILMCQWFAPTQLKVTFETEGKGAFTPEEIERVVEKDAKGNLVSLNLPTKFVLIANHQVYVDWYYAWCLLYFIGKEGTNVHRHVYITLKKSLKWVPIIGWGMQFYNFIFLARSWASDRLQLSTALSKIGKDAEREHIPFAFIMYPEGTLVSSETRPISKKYADKMGIDDMTHTLLPRSTGLHYSLRSLVPRIPGLRLIDITVAYPGIPPLGYGQDYYTLRSIFFDGVPPPSIHMHLRMFTVGSDVPIGDLSSSNPKRTPDESGVEVEIPENEKSVFDEWLRGLWREKDAAMARFLQTGTFDTCGEKPVQIPLRLRRSREVFDAFCFFLPAAAGYAWQRLRG